jgi:hypothetical protein
MASMKDHINGYVDSGFIHLRIKLSEEDIKATKLLDSIPELIGKQNITMADAEQILLNALWWIRTLGSTGEQKDE